MSFEEKNIWIYAAVTAVSFAVYVVVVLARARDVPVAEVAYITPMLWTIGGAIVAAVLGRILTAAVWPKEAGKPDVRDQEIERLGAHTGKSFVVIGALAALILAMFEADHFWIANAIYLCFALSALLEAATRIAAYRMGFQPW